MPAFPSPRFTIVKLLRHEFRTFEPSYRDFECNKYGGAQPAHKIPGAQIATGRVNPRVLSYGIRDSEALVQRALQINYGSDELDRASVKAVGKLLDSSLLVTMDTIRQGRTIRRHDYASKLSAIAQ
jgi:hypothetical protein